MDLLSYLGTPCSGEKEKERSKLTSRLHYSQSKREPFWGDEPRISPCGPDTPLGKFSFDALDPGPYSRRSSVIAGLPWESWLLLLGSVGIPLAAVTASARAHRRSRPTQEVRDPRGAGEPDS